MAMVNQYCVNWFGNSVNVVMWTLPTAETPKLNFSSTLWDNFSLQPNEKSDPANWDEATVKRRNIEFQISTIKLSSSYWGEAAPTPLPAWNHRAAHSLLSWQLVPLSTHLDSACFSYEVVISGNMSCDMTNWPTPTAYEVTDKQKQKFEGPLLLTLGADIQGSVRKLYFHSEQRQHACEGCHVKSNIRKHLVNFSCAITKLLWWVKGGSYRGTHWKALWFEFVPMIHHYYQPGTGLICQDGGVGMESAGTKKGRERKKRQGKRKKD